MLTIVTLFQLSGCTGQNNQIEISFIDYDGSVVQSYKIDSGSDLSEIIAPTNLQREGYSFIGWDTDIPEKMPKKSILINAIYNVNNYTVYFKDKNGLAYDSMIFEYGSDLSDLAQKVGPKIDNYKFTNWNIDIPEKMPAHDIILQANYTYERFIKSEYHTQTGKSDGFAIEVLQYGDYVIVSAPYYRQEIGAVFVYKISDPSYERTILGSEQLDQCFGISIKSDGEYLIISSYGLKGTWTGKVDIYKLEDENYKRSITPQGLRPYDYYGLNGASIQDDFIMVGATGQNNRSGNVYIYKFSDPNYQRIIYGKEDNARFGSTIHSNSSYFVVSAPEYKSNQGAAYLYKFDDETYERELSIDGIDSSDAFGTHLYIESDFIIISAPGYNLNQGMVAIFKISDTNYTRVIYGNETLEGSYFGARLLVSNNGYIAVNSAINQGGQGVKFLLYSLNDENYLRENQDFQVTIFVSQDFIYSTDTAKNIVHIYKFSDSGYHETIDLSSYPVNISSSNLSIAVDEVLVVGIWNYYSDGAVLIIDKK
jgi:hypothetical protein